jgi:hypothetical protein
LPTQDVKRFFCVVVNVERWPIVGDGELQRRVPTLGRRSVRFQYHVGVAGG